MEIDKLYFINGKSRRAEAAILHLQQYQTSAGNYFPTATATFKLDL